VDVAAIGVESFTGTRPQRDERFLIAASVLRQIGWRLGLAAAVVVFVAEPAADLGGGVPVLGRGGFVVDEDRVDDRLNRSQERSESIPGRREGVRLGVLANRPDGVSRRLECARDQADGLAIASRPPNGTVVVHGKHVRDPP
jgi:hypothetical protein